jgi:hypothetical protein
LPAGRQGGKGEVEKRTKISFGFDKSKGTPLGLVPAGSGATKVKQEEKTIEDKDFYNKLFAALEKELGIVRTH